MRSNSHLQGRWRLPLTLLATLVLSLLVISGCGGDEDSDAATTTATTAASTGSEAAETGSEAETPAADAKDGADRSQKARTEGGVDKSEDGNSSESKGGEVVVPPNRHKDSGGGSKQFRTPGGDNSIQDFGNEASPDEFKEVAAIVHAFLDARAAGKTEVACRYLASSIIDQLLQFAEGAPEAPDDCAGMLDALTVPLNARIKRMISQADIGSVRVDGDQGFVLYRGFEKKVHVMPVVREDGHWKVAAIAGSPMP